MNKIKILSGLGADNVRVYADEIIESGSTLSDKYLGISGTSINSDKLNDQNSSYYLNADNISGGTENTYSQWVTTGTSIYYTGDSVGIKTNDPDEILHISTTTGGTGGLFGNAFIGVSSYDNDNAVFSHNEQKNNDGGYAVMQDSSGSTHLNALSGKSINVRINNNIVSDFSTTGLTVSGNVIGNNLNITNWNSGYTHISNDGTDHSDVVLNNTHRTSDGSDHSGVTANTTHRSSNGTDHSDVVLNNTHRTSDGSDHSGVTANTIHRTSNGTDHSYIDQDVTSTANPTFNNLIVSGDLSVSGTTTTINSETLLVEDKNIEIGDVVTPTDVTADGGGITLKGATNKTITWDNANDNWTLNQNVNIPSGNTYKINNVNLALADLTDDATHRIVTDTEKTNWNSGYTHISNDGTDHSDVVLNNTHRNSDGSDHSGVTANTTHRTSDGTDHSYIDQDVTTGATPTFSGANLDGGVIVNEAGVDVDFRVEGVGQSNALFVQGSDGYVSIGSNTNLSGDFNITGSNTEPTQGSEQVTNGDFASDLTSWTVGANWAWDTGIAKHTTGSVATLSQDVSVTASNFYLLEFDIVGMTAGTLTASLGGITADALSADITDYAIMIEATSTAVLTFTPSTDFDGAIDNVSVTQFTASTPTRVVYKDDNIIAYEERVSPSERSSIYLGANAGRFDIQTTTNPNIGIGFNVLTNLTSGNFNLGVGNRTLEALTTGLSNFALGTNSLLKLKTGDNNIGIASNALGNLIVGDDNISIGRLSMFSTKIANRNIAIGRLAGQNAGDDNVFIGYNTGKNETGSNKLYIANTDTATPLIYGEFDNNLLQINGTLEVLGTTRTYNNLINNVLIKSESDFPTAVGGYIDLDTNVEYTISGNVLIYNSIRVPDGSINKIKSAEFGSSALVYMGTDALFKDDSHRGILGLAEIIISAPLGKVFDIADTTKVGSVIHDFCIFNNCSELGNLNDVALTLSFSKFADCGQGFTFNDNISIAIMDLSFNTWKNQAGCKYMRFTGDHGQIRISGHFAKTAGANENIFDIDSGMTTTGGQVFGTQNNIAAGGNVFASGSKNQTDPDWTWTNNGGISDSAVTAAGYLLSNALTTDIPAIDAWVGINGNTWTSDIKERTEVDSDGVLKYIGLEDTTLLLDGNVSLEPTVATKDLSMRFCKIHAHHTFTVTFTNATNLINETGTTLSDGDNISFKNTTGTLPAELRTDIIYYVVNKLTNSFQVAYTSGGTAIAFTDDGTPTNIYSVADLTGSMPREPIGAGAPRDLVPHGLITVSKDCEVVGVVQNKSDTVNINVINVFFRAKK